MDSDNFKASHLGENATNGSAKVLNFQDNEPCVSNRKYERAPPYIWGCLESVI